ncbi:2159_t:CDS:2 [Entrophospora sp. SA101]|nr:2159_t:CDS:2 [Entrophospora sp. SA101]
MIMYWKSNAKTELGFYGLNNKKKTCLSDAEINISISETFSEIDDNDNESEGEGEGETSFHKYDIDEYENVNITDEDEKGILDYNIDDLLGEFVSEEV